ncbi:MAG: S8 family serine peptidase [Bdellovibrionales bacterium]|nr:S8 family serine peptidase [Bdellovibrionales bacterium]
MKKYSNILTKLICLMTLLFSYSSYSKNLNFSKKSDTYIIKISDHAYSSILESIADKEQSILSTQGLGLNLFQNHKKQNSSAVSLNRIYQNIDPQYKKMIKAMGGVNSNFGILTSPTEDNKIKLLKNLQLIIIKSKNFNADYLSTFPDIKLIEKDKYFYLHQKSFNKKQTWAINNKNLSRLFNVYINSNKRSSLKKNNNFFALDAIQARKAWENYNNQGENTKVMIADTGVDASHPDLIDSFEKGRNFLPDSSDDLFTDKVGHGTHIAGTVLGSVYGVAAKSKLFVAKVCVYISCYSSAILQSLDWAIEERVDVINLSLGGFKTSSAADKAYEIVAKNGILIVAASGNSGNIIKNTLSYPASNTNTISVGSVKFENNNFKKSSFSQYSKKLDIVAPGENIISSVPLDNVKKTLNLYVKKTDKEEKIIKIESSLFISPKNKIFKAIKKTNLVLSTDEYLFRKFVLFFVDKNILNKRKFIAKLKSLARNKVAGVFFSGEANYMYQLSDILQNNKFAFTKYEKLFSSEMAQKFKQAILNPKVNISFGIDIKKNIKYHKKTGTSMSAPHVSGVLALSKSAKPSLGLDQARLLLHNSAKFISSSVNGETGKGLVQANNLLDLIR